MYSVGYGDLIAAIDQSMQKCFAILLLIFISPQALATPAFPDLSAHHVNGERSQLKWDEAPWAKLFQGKHFQRIDFLDPDTNQMIHQLEFIFDDERLVSITIDRRFSFSFTSHFQRIADRVYNSADEIKYEQDSNEYAEVVLEESMITAKNFLEFLESHSSYFAVQALFHPDGDLVTNPRALTYRGYWTAKGVGVGMEIVSAALLAVAFLGPIPEPISPYLSYKTSRAAKRNFQLAHEITRRTNGSTMGKVREPLPLMIWKFIERQSWGRNFLMKVDDKFTRTSRACHRILTRSFVN